MFLFNWTVIIEIIISHISKSVKITLSYIRKYVERIYFMFWFALIESMLQFALAAFFADVISSEYDTES